MFTSPMGCYLDSLLCTQHRSVRNTTHTSLTSEVYISAHVYYVEMWDATLATSWLFKGKWEDINPPWETNINSPMLQTLVTMEMCLSIAPLVALNTLWLWFAITEVHGSWHLTDSAWSWISAPVYNRLQLKCNTNQHAAVSYNTWGI